MVSREYLSMEVIVASFQGHYSEFTVNDRRVRGTQFQRLIMLFTQAIENLPQDPYSRHSGPLTWNLVYFGISK